MTLEQKSKRIALIATLLFAGLVLLLLLFLSLRSLIPPKNNNTIELDLLAQEGLLEPAVFNETAQTAAPALASTSPGQPSDERLITQEHEASIAAAKAEKERKQREAEEQKRRREQEEKARRANALGQNAFTSQNSSGSDRQNGSPLGGTSTTSNSGSSGVSVSSNLQGRSVSTPKPQYDTNDYGVVVVDIQVNDQGKVTSASVNLKGTNTNNLALRKAAVDAARKAEFSAQQGAQDQTGTITYTFKLNLDANIK